MTTEKMLKKLVIAGWTCSFDEERWEHTAERGCMKYRKKSVSELYKVIKKEFKWG